MGDTHYEEARKIPPKFVSLGADCTIAQHLNHNQLRTEAYPFDWLMTHNDANFIFLIENNFIYFMDEQYLKPNPHYVRNTYYNIDFYHDWPSGRFDEHLAEVKIKYARRIQRFYALDKYKGKVYFIRGAFNHPDKDKDLSQVGELVYQSCRCDNPNIDYLRAKNIKMALDHKFPHLDFSLVIINFVENPGLGEIMNDQSIMEFRVRNSHIHEDFTKIFGLLSQNEQGKK